MDKQKLSNHDVKKCLFVINLGTHYKAVNEHIKDLNGFYNGAGWYVEYKNKEAILQLCQNSNLQLLDFPLLEDSFEDLRRKHKSSYYHQKSIKIQLEICRLRDVLNIPQGINIDEILNNELFKGFEQIPQGNKLIELTDEYEVLQKRIKYAQEEEQLSKLSLNTGFKYLLEPASEEKIIEEVRNTSSGVNVGYRIGDIDLK